MVERPTRLFLVCQLCRICRASAKAHDAGHAGCHASGRSVELCHERRLVYFGVKLVQMELDEPYAFDEGIMGIRTAATLILRYNV
jgi:hypothetical protein